MKTFGSDRLEPGPDGSILLICRVAKGWLARQTRTLTRAEYPGTAIRTEEGLFEVLDVIAETTGGIRYRLAAWEGRHTIRGVEAYDEASEAARQSEQDRRLASLRLRRLSVILAPLLGHLPARVQLRMESEFGAHARAMTIASALPLLALAVFGVLAFLVGALGGGFEGLLGGLILPLPVAVFLGAESVLRLGVAFLHAEPMGSVIGVLAYALYVRIWPRRVGVERYASPSEPSQPEKENA